jgi:hypothetical protein
MVRSQNRVLTPLTLRRKSGFHLLFILPKSSFGGDKMFEMEIVQQMYAPQTKILEGGTKDEIRIFDGLFNGTWPNDSSPKSSTHVLEKCVETMLRTVRFVRPSNIFVWES